MRGIGRKSATISVIVYYPKSEEGRQKLLNRAASVHADMVVRHIQKLKCPLKQKERLVDAIINTVINKKEVGDRTC